MTAISRSVAISLLGLGFAAACSSTPAPKLARGLAPTATVAKADPPAPARSSDTSANVAIDDAILGACHIRTDEAYFRFDSSKLESRDVSPLSAVAKCFSDGALKGRSLKLVGRADPRGDDEYNMVLGQSRADRVGDALYRDGLGRSQMTSTSRGDLDAKGQDESGWIKDRRVDVLLGS
ncbi:MAG TPA: OmpA family protein [Polyangiaceae bacterium]|jgi:peptidoglycan-associated lipoprotein|nr:OmpA family protein [Polyangiaceae bacterium]